MEVLCQLACASNILITYLSRIIYLFIFNDYKYRLKQERATLVKSKEKLQAKLEKYKIYHKYMEKALEAGEEFHEMRDIIARHDTLVATHEVNLYIK
jgi:arginyl-tRNA--protein-N-Asp/Glu arginylyltransferase